jgi:hypothetical protein
MAIGYYKDRFYPETIAAVADAFLSVIKSIISEASASQLDSTSLPPEVSETPGSQLVSVSQK